MKNITYFLEISGGVSGGSRYIGFTREWLCERDSTYRKFHKDSPDPEFVADDLSDGFVWIRAYPDNARKPSRGFTVYFGLWDKLPDVNNEEEFRIESDLEQGEFRKIRLNLTKRMDENGDIILA